MLKTPTNAATSSRVTPSTSRNLRLDSSFQTPANPPALSGSPDKWETYVNGGAQVDDARLLQKRREEEAAFENARRDGLDQSKASNAAYTRMTNASGTLIQTSPRKPTASVSGNTDLLVNLDINTSYDAHPPQQQAVSYASAARCKGKRHGGSEWNLMD